MKSKSVINQNKPLALLIDDEQAICESLAGVLEDEGWQVLTANSGRQGLIEFKYNLPDIVFLDVWMPGIDGIETLQSLKEMNRDVPVVIMSGHATIETAVRATKLGAFDFLEKPLSLEKILPLLESARQVKRSQKSTSTVTAKHQLIGASQSLLEIRQQIAVVAPRNAWVLITGENGTGKEVVAMNIHARSLRSQNAFIAVNCAAIPEELIESELFGHAKGAFTGAIANQKGRFELANQGTLFLDEIADMSLKTQAKILRVLQEQQFERVGGEESIKVDVRVIAATNKDLPSEIAAGRFREDLYYRLNVVPFHLAPLRERQEDIPVLAEHFLHCNAMELGEPTKVLSAEALQAFKTYPWPGNVRELRNICERLCIMVQGQTITLGDMPPALRGGIEEAEDDRNYLSNSATLKEAKSDFERAFILEKLEECQWNVSKTAETIGVERSNLHRKLRTYNIDTKKLKN